MSKKITYTNNTGERKTLLLKDTLGEGSSGIVYRAILDGFGLVALKSMKLTPQSEKFIENDLIVRKQFGDVEDPHFILVRRVIIHISMMAHPLFTKYRDFIGLSDDIPPSTAYCIYKCADSVDLFEMLSVSNERYPKELIGIFFTQLCVGLKILHDKKIAHRDIKVENIMMDEGVLKYIDFGFSCLQSDCFKNSNLGTPMYASPDLIKKKIPQDFETFLKRDIYALGITFYVILTKTDFPVDYRKIAQIQDIEMLEAIYIQIIEKNIQAEWRPLILGMINPSEDKRYNIQQCIDVVEGVFL